MTDEIIKKGLEAPLELLGGLLKQGYWLAWTILVLIVIWKIVPEFFDQLDVWKAQIVAPIGKRFKFKILSRAAVKYDVRGHVNKAIDSIARELPEGWISKIDIKYVNGESRAEFFANNRPIVHLRPSENQERNVVSVINIFLREALFGSVRQIIPDLQRTAAILYFGDRIATSRSSETAKAFGEFVLEPAIKGKPKIMDYYKRYCDIDERGFFTGPFIREVKHVAEEVRLARFHNKMSTEMNSALVHLEQFSAAYKKSQEDGTGISDDAWTRSGITAKYGLLLVANPNKAINEETAGYVRRATSSYRRGIKRLYVLGTASQLDFVNKVVIRIESETEYVLEERFRLYRDYRGAVGGVGAVFSSAIRKADTSLPEKPNAQIENTLG